MNNLEPKGDFEASQDAIDQFINTLAADDSLSTEERIDAINAVAHDVWNIDQISDIGEY